MPKLATWTRVEGDLFVYDTPTLDELARQTAIQIRDAQVRPLIHATMGFCNYRNPRFVGDLNIEDVWAEGADEPNLGMWRIACPCCQRKIAPWLSKARVCIGGGWRWVGLDYQEPYGDYFAACGWCGEPFLFSTHTPQ